MYQYPSNTNATKLRKVGLFISLISLIPFLLLAVQGYSDWSAITEIDYKIGAFFYNLRTPIRTDIAIAITRIADRFGQTLITVLVTFILILMKKWRTGLWYGLMVLIGSDFLNDFTKSIFERVRPDQIDHLVEQGGYAFPSGHSMGSMIIFGGLLFLFIQYFNSKNSNKNTVKWLFSIGSGLLILAIGLSRIYLGVHYPSDVLGGFSLGLSWLSLNIALIGIPFTKQEFRPKKRYRFKQI